VLLTLVVLLRRIEKRSSIKLSWIGLSCFSSVMAETRAKDLPLFSRKRTGNKQGA